MGRLMSTRRPQIPRKKKGDDDDDDDDDSDVMITIRKIYGK